MSRAQRFTFLGIAVVIAIVAIIVLADSSEDDTTPPTENADATATATATATEDQPEASAQETATPTPEAPPLLTGGKVTKLEFTEGDTVRFRVRSDVPEEVHIHGYDIAKDLEPNQTTTVSFKATITGIFEIEFEDAKEQIAELRVNPK
jgi:FtsP/CotA-like multicopper oxidase with cupredoxin domain